MKTTAVGFRVKSGWAVAVLLAGPSAAPKVIDRQRVQLSDPAVPDSCQPYHAGLDLPSGEAAKEVARLVKVVERFASRSLNELFDQYRAAGHRICGAGIAVGSAVDPATIPNDHIRAHAEKGRLFRVVIEDAVRKCGLITTVTVKQQLRTKAARVLDQAERQLMNAVTALGRDLGGPWRAEEKAATLAAWLLLA